MLVVLSPSKTLDFDAPAPFDEHTQPEFLDSAEQLVDTLREYDVDELGELMDISEKLATLNVERYQNFETPFTPDNAKQAIAAFKGDVYRDFALEEYDAETIEFLQKHVRILSGLYGVLRPLDLMQPYRLEMGTKLEVDGDDDLYDYWGERLADSINGALDAQGDDIILNLASNQYFRAIDRDNLDGRVIKPTFKDERGDRYMKISFYLKRNRGTLTDWLVRNHIESPDRFEEFAENGYYYSPEESTPEAPVYLRDEE